MTQESSVISLDCLTQSIFICTPWLNAQHTAESFWSPKCHLWALASTASHHVCAISIAHLPLLLHQQTSDRKTEKEDERQRILLNRVVAVDKRHQWSVCVWVSQCLSDTTMIMTIRRIKHIHTHSHSNIWINWMNSLSLPLNLYTATAEGNTTGALEHLVVGVVHLTAQHLSREHH